MKTNTTKLRRALNTFAKTGKITLTATALMALALSAPANADDVTYTTISDTQTLTPSTASQPAGIVVSNDGSLTISGYTADSPLKLTIGPDPGFRDGGYGAPLYIQGSANINGHVEASGSKNGVFVESSDGTASASLTIGEGGYVKAEKHFGIGATYQTTGSVKVDGGILHAADSIQLGHFGHGTLTLISGKIITGENFHIASDLGYKNSKGDSQGTFTMTGGELEVGTSVHIVMDHPDGKTGVEKTDTKNVGKFNMSGGTASVKENFNLATYSGDFRETTDMIDASATISGDAKLTIGKNVSIGNFCGNPVAGTMTVSDNAYVSVGGNVDLCELANLNIFGGTFAVKNGSGITNEGTITNVGDGDKRGSMVISGNKASAGAGMFNTGSFTFESKKGATLLVERNSASGWGSGITSKGDGAKLTLTGAENADGSKTIQINYNHTSGDVGAGGLNLYSGVANISNASFTGNAVNTYGGAIWAGYGAEVTLTDVVMDGGTLNKDTLPNWKNTGYFRNACYGGGLYMRDANVTVDGLTISNMVIFGEDVQNNIYAAGGGIHVGHENAELHIVGDGLTISGTNSNLNKTATVWGAGMNVGGKVFVKSQALIENNRTERDGGGIYVAGQEEHLKYVYDSVSGNWVTTNDYNSLGSFTVNEGAALTLANNMAANGAGLYLEGGDNAGSFTNAGTLNVIGNTATGKGGGIYAGTDLTLGGTGTFSGNTAEIAGNDIYAEKNVTFSEGAKYSFDGGIVSDGTMKVSSGADVALKSGSGSKVASLENNGTVRFELDPAGSQFGMIETGPYSGNGNVAVGVNGFTVMGKNDQTQTIVSGANVSGNVTTNTDLFTVNGGTDTTTGGTDTTVTVKETGKIGDSFGNVAAAGTPGLDIFQKDADGNYVTAANGQYDIIGESDKIHNFSFIVDTANSDIVLKDFADWLGEETGLKTAVGTGYVSVRLDSPFEIMSDDRFVWDFSGYDNGAGALLQYATVNIMDSTVPEPTTWALLVLGGLGIFGVARKNRKAKK